MRQAGRSLPEYREVRAGIAMLESCLTPKLAAEITLQPVRRHGVDAAIFFSDIVVPLKLAGIDVEIQPGVGPVVAMPIRAHDDLARLLPLQREACGPIADAVHIVVDELGSTPLIGFGGAPFTLASYLIEGGPSKSLPESRRMMTEQPELWAAVLSWCADITATFIRVQVEAGASALQVFDSWAGKLTPGEYRAFAMPYTRRLFDNLNDLVDSEGHSVPRIHFGVGTGPILRDMANVGATAVGIDAQTSLDEAARVIPGIPLQGNIDAELLGADWAELEDNIRSVLHNGEQAPGHIVNLGHGVPPATDPDVLTRIVTLVHELTK